MNNAENRKLVKAMLAPYHLLKQLDDVLSAAEVAERAIPDLQKHVGALNAEVAQKTIERDQHIAQCNNVIVSQNDEVARHKAQCSKEIEDAQARMQDALHSHTMTHAQDLEKVRAESVAVKATLANEVTALRTQHDDLLKNIERAKKELRKSVNELEVRQKSAQEVLDMFRAKVVD